MKETSAQRVREAMRTGKYSRDEIMAMYPEMTECQVAAAMHCVRLSGALDSRGKLRGWAMTEAGYQASIGAMRSRYVRAREAERRRTMMAKYRRLLREIAAAKEVDRYMADNRHVISVNNFLAGR